MPVIDHPIHPKTQIGADHRYGCWNRHDRFDKSYAVPARRYFPDGTFDMVSVKVSYRMSHDCRYDGNNGKEKDDPGCMGCRHYKKSQYLAHVAEKGR